MKLHHVQGGPQADGAVGAMRGECKRSITAHALDGAASVIGMAQCGASTITGDPTQLVVVLHCKRIDLTDLWAMFMQELRQLPTRGCLEHVGRDVFGRDRSSLLALAATSSYGQDNPRQKRTPRKLRRAAPLTRPYVAGSGTRQFTFTCTP